MRHRRPAIGVPRQVAVDDELGRRERASQPQLAVAAFGQAELAAA